MQRNQAEYQREYDVLANENDWVNSQIQAMEDRNQDKGKRRRKLGCSLAF